MGRRKLEIKRIEDKSSRQVTFTKRRGGLFKKARHLSVLCEADVAVVIFSSRGKLFEHSSGGCSVAQVISRYQRSCNEPEASTTAVAAQVNLPSHYPRFRTCDELLQAVKRLSENPNTEECSVTDLEKLEEDLCLALMQTRSRKTKLMMEYVSTLHEKEKKLSQEKHELEQQVCSAKVTANGDDGGGGLDVLATNHLNLPQFLTLSLFKS